MYSQGELRRRRICGHRPCVARPAVTRWTFIFFCLYIISIDLFIIRFFLVVVVFLILGRLIVVGNMCNMGTTTSLYRERQAETDGVPDSFFFFCPFIFLFF